jgi:hypothetical protein
VRLSHHHHHTFKPHIHQHNTTPHPIPFILSSIFNSSHTSATAINKMLCKSVISILALTSAVAASPALRRDFACNPAHSYPNGAQCISTAGGLALVTPAPTPTPTAGAASGCVAKDFICRNTRSGGLSANQAQCSADNEKCIGDCYAAYNVCRTTRKDGLSANQAQCVADYAACLGRNPVSPTGGLTILPYTATATVTASTTATSATATATNCIQQEIICRNTRKDGLSANQAQCSADKEACIGACYAAFNVCRTTRKDGLSANQAQCVADYAACLGENPVASTGGITVLPYTATARTATASTATAATTMVTSAVPAPKTYGYKDPKKVDGQTWTLNNVIRFCADGSSTCDYNFDIVANGKTEHCTIVNASKESFSNQKCADGDYSVSWGYVANPAPAFAVITVVDKQNQLAWFGASNVDSQRSWGNLGPEQVYTYN